MVFGAFRGPGRVPGVFMRDGTAYNARNYLFFRVLFHLKNSKKSAQTITEVTKPPRNYSLDPLRGGESYLRSLFGLFCLK